MSPPTPKVDLEGLKTAAEKATPGPWGCDDSEVYQENPEHAMIAETVPLDGDNDPTGFSQQERANAAFIALANPATVLALIAEVEVLKAHVSLAWSDAIDRRARAEQAEALLTQAEADKERMREEAKVAADFYEFVLKWKSRADLGEATDEVFRSIVGNHPTLIFHRKALAALSLNDARELETARDHELSDVDHDGIEAAS